MNANPQESEPDRTGVIDVIAHDPKTGEAVLVMNEPNEWDASDEQLLDLQERFNAYVSFLLDGEMVEAHPEFAGKPARIELRCAHMPDSRALELLGLIHDQLAFQEIKMEVVIRNDEIRMTARGLGYHFSFRASFVTRALSFSHLMSRGARS